MCTLQVEPDLLVLRAEADDEAHLAEVEGVVARHLERFAWRDKPAIEWRRTA